MLSRPPHEVSSRFVFIRFIFFLDNSFDLHNRSSAFLMMRYGKGAGNTDKGNFFFFFFLNPPPIQRPSSAQPQNKKKKKRKKEIENMVMLFTQLSLICLDLNYKHTSIFQLHTSPTYSVPLDRYSLLLFKTLSLSLSLSCQQCYKRNP